MRPACFRRPLTVLAVGVGVLLLGAAPVAAATPHLAVVSVPMGGIIGDIFGSIAGAVLGAFTWTIKLASEFLLTTIGALVHLLIPRSWVHQGLQIVQWIVQVPNYAGHVTSPSGRSHYGFAGINALRDTFQWLGIAIAPLTLVYGTTRAMVTESEPVGIPILRFVATAVVIASYPYWWTELSALADNVTNVILSVPAVTNGLYKLMTYITGGVALGGWQIVDLAMMLALALELLGLIFTKVVIILLGALLYATGPLALGLVPTRAGSALARAWASAAVAMITLGIAWASLFAVGAVLVGDSSSAGPLIAGTSALGSIAGGLLLACAGAVSLWLCLKAARELSSVLRMQLGGLLVLGSARAGGAGGTAARSTNSLGRTTSSSLRSYGQRLSRAAGAATGAAGGQLAYAGGANPWTVAAGGAMLGQAGRGAAFVGRRGLAGTAAAGVGRAASLAAPRVASRMSRSRAGAVAVQMAKAGTASWRSGATAAAAAAAGGGAGAATSGRRRGRSSTTPPPAGGTSSAGASRQARAGSSTPLARRPSPSSSSGASPPVAPPPAAPKTPPSRPRRRGRPWRRKGEGGR